MGTSIDRRKLLLLAGLAAAGADAKDAGSPPVALTVKPLQFPRDHGAHPAFRTEWWKQRRT
jgi:predicted secreted hydrolase